VTRLLQSENVLQLLINLFIFASISWYNDILGCKPPLNENFIYKMFFKHSPWYIKVPQILKIVKLWQFFVYTIVCFHPWEYLSNESNHVCHNKMMGKQEGFLSITFHMYFILIIWCYLYIILCIPIYQLTLLCVHYAFHRHKNYNKLENDELEHNLKNII